MRSRNNWVALGVLALAALVVGVDLTVLNVALPTLAASLDADTTQLQWIVNAYVLVLAGAMLPAGALGDRYGRRRLLLAGLVIFLVGSIGAALADNAPWLIAMRAVLGIGAAIIISITVAIVPVLFDEERRPTAVGAMTAAVGAGLPLGLIVGGYLLKNFAWQSIFWMNVPVAVIAIAGVVALVGESRNPSAPRVDLIGTAAAVLGTASLVYGFIGAPREGWASVATIGFVAAGIALLIGFVAWQSRTDEPLVDLALFRDQRFAGGSVAMLLIGFVMFALLFTVPQYLQAVRFMDALETGLWLLPMMAGLVIGAGATKRLATTIGAAGGTVGGLLIIAASLAALSAVTAETDLAWVSLGLAVFGLGAGMAMAAALESVLGSLPKEHVGVGSAVASTFRQIGGALGVAILGSILLSGYRDALNAAMLGALPPQAAGAVRASIAGAMQVVQQLGPAGQALDQMADASYTAAMSRLLLGSAVAGFVAAIVSGWMMRPHRSARTRAREA